MKRLLSLFDYSGQWAEPFHNAGWDVILWDIKLDEFMNVFTLDSAETCLDLFEYINGVLCAIPCTEFAVSGSRWWKKKDAAGDTGRALKVAYQALKVCDLFTPTDPDYDDVFFYAIENPVGRLARLAQLGDAYYFDPYEFAGYLNPSPETLERLEQIRKKNGHGITPDEAELIFSTNAYTKKNRLVGRVQP